MKTTHFEIRSPYPLEKVVEILKEMSDEKGSITKSLKGRKFVGKVDENRLGLSTYDAPPTQIFGEIKAADTGTVLSLRVSDLADSPFRKQIVFALCYPIWAVGLIIAIVVNPGNMLNYIIGGVAAIAIYLFGKVIQWVEPQPYPKRPVLWIQQALNGQLTEKKSGK